MENLARRKAGSFRSPRHLGLSYALRRRSPGRERKSDWRGLHRALAQFGFCSHPRHYRSNRGKIEPAGLCQPRFSGGCVAAGGIASRNEGNAQTGYWDYVVGGGSGRTSCRGRIDPGRCTGGGRWPAARAARSAGGSSGTDAGGASGQIQAAEGGALLELDVRIGERPSRGR